MTDSNIISQEQEDLTAVNSRNTSTSSYYRSGSLCTDDFNDIKIWSLKTADMLMAGNNNNSRHSTSSRNLHHHGHSESIGIIDLDNESIFAIESEWDTEADLGISPSRTEENQLKKTVINEEDEDDMPQIIMKSNPNIELKYNMQEEEEEEEQPQIELHRSHSTTLNSTESTMTLTHQQRQQRSRQLLNSVETEAYINTAFNSSQLTLNIIDSQLEQQSNVTASSNTENTLKSNPSLKTIDNNLEDEDSPVSLDKGAIKLELENVMKLAEQEIMKLNEQVNMKSYNLELAQRAMTSYEEELREMKQKLKAMDDNRSEERQRRGFVTEDVLCEEEVIHKLVRVRSNASRMRQSITDIKSDVIYKVQGSEFINDRKNTTMSMDSNNNQRQQGIESVSSVLIEQLASKCKKSEDEILALKSEKKRLQEMLRLAEEEAIMVLSETHDADEEVHTYLKRLDESQRQREKLERELRQAKTELSSANKEIENLKLSKKQEEEEKEEEEKKKKETESLSIVPIEDLSLLNFEISKSFHDVVDKLGNLENANVGLRERLENLGKNAEMMISSSNSPGKEASRIQMTRTGNMMSVKGENALISDDMMVAMTGEVPETDMKTSGEIKILKEALNLALEANQLLEAKVIPSEEIKNGLLELEEEIKRLNENLINERKKNLHELTIKDNMILELEEEQERVKGEILQVREALGLALEAKTALEIKLEDLQYEFDHSNTNSSYIEYQPNYKYNTDAQSNDSDHLQHSEEVGNEDSYVIEVLKQKIESGNYMELKKAAILALDKLEDALKTQQEINMRNSDEITSTNSELSIHQTSCKTTSVKSCDSPDVLSTLVSETLDSQNYIKEEEDSDLIESEDYEDKLSEVDSDGFHIITIPSMTFNNLKKDLEQSHSENLTLQSQIQTLTQNETIILSELSEIKKELSSAYEENNTFLKGFAQIKSNLEIDIQNLQEEVREQKIVNADFLAATEDLKSLQKEVWKTVGTESSNNNLNLNGIMEKRSINNKEMTAAESIRRITRGLMEGFKLMVGRLGGEKEIEAIRQMLNEEKRLSEELKNQVKMMDYVKDQYMNSSKETKSKFMRSASELEYNTRFDARMNSEYRTQDTERKKLMESISRKDLEIQLLQNSLEEYITSNNTLETSLLNLEDEIKQLNEENKKLVQEKDKPKIREIINIKDDNDIACELSMRIVSLQEQIQDMQEELLNVKEENSELKTNNKKLGRQIYA